MGGYIGTCETCCRGVRSAHVSPEGRHTAMVRNTGYGEEADACNGVILDGNGRPLEAPGCLQCDPCDKRGPADARPEGACERCGHFGCWRVEQRTTEVDGGAPDA